MAFLIFDEDIIPRPQTPPPPPPYPILSTSAPLHPPLAHFPFTKLPLELQLLIISHLPPSSLFRLRQTSSTFHSLIPAPKASDYLLIETDLWILHGWSHPTQPQLWYQPTTQTWSPALIPPGHACAKQAPGWLWCVRCEAMKRREGFRMALEMERMPRGKWWGRRKCEACHRREFVKFKERAERMERERAGVGGE